MILGKGSTGFREFIRAKRQFLLSDFVERRYSNTSKNLPMLNGRHPLMCLAVIGARCA
jgi:hypothetical protein